MSTTEQKDVFTRLHGIFTKANSELADAKVELDRLTADYARLNEAFNEQNETLKRYENTFGILPAEPYAARDPFTYEGVLRGAANAAEPAPSFNDPLPMPGIPKAPPAHPDFAKALNVGINEATLHRNTILSRMRDLFGPEAGIFLFRKIFDIV